MLAFQPAARYAPIMDQVYAELVSQCAPLQGTRLWAQGFCRLSVLMSMPAFLWLQHVCRSGSLALASQAWLGILAWH